MWIVTIAGLKLALKTEQKHSPTHCRPSTLVKLTPLVALRSRTTEQIQTTRATLEPIG
jgi:hypothetical protein